MTMNKERLEAWISALESGEFEKIKGRYFGHLDSNQACALGVGGIVRDKFLGQGHTRGFLLPGLMDFYGLPSPDAEMIANWNDKGSLSFWEIAQRLREKYLKEEA